MTSFIWFQLVDLNGQPYKATNADKVQLSTGSDVAQLRDAVKVKNSNKLSSCDAADLVVYKNKESFDKRNNEVEQERKVPLKSSGLLGGLGATEDEALIIVVPPLLMTTDKRNVADIGGMLICSF